MSRITAPPLLSLFIIPQPAKRCGCAGIVACGIIVCRFRSVSNCGGSAYVYRPSALTRLRYLASCTTEFTDKSFVKRRFASHNPTDFRHYHRQRHATGSGRRFAGAALLTRLGGVVATSSRNKLGEARPRHVYPLRQRFDRPDAPVFPA